MNVYIIDTSLMKEENKNTVLFNKIVCEQLKYYGVDFSEVNKITFSKCKNKLIKDSIVIVYNEYKTQGDEQKDLQAFLKAAEEIQAEIWPVAIDRDTRIPSEVISKRQSYDVWEQLRCRNLDESYLPVIAKAFSRKIVSKVLPTLYSEYGEFFLSHKRLDGEEITAKIYEKMILHTGSNYIFRDVVKVRVGGEAQEIIDRAMESSDIFIFIHTPKSAHSDWILKELRYAVLRNIPILWVQIDDADISMLKIKPSENPHLKFKTEDFLNDKSAVEAVDQILEKAFELIIISSNKVFDYLDTINQLFGERSSVKNQHDMIYQVAVERKGYHYPQREIRQYYQVYGRTATSEDAQNLFLQLKDETADSIVILSDRVLKLSTRGNIVLDSIEDFYYHWNTYINGRKREAGQMEIVISGAYPDCDEIYKQSLTDALVLFAKAIMKNGYQLTFGSHPTFQELFFEIAKDVNPKEARNMLNMYISEWFLENERDKEPYFKERCQLNKTEKKDDCDKSLSAMRKAMIQRKKVKALICLGGKNKEEKKKEGIREEIQLALEYQIPVFIVGSAGGCSARVAKEYKNDGWFNLNHAPEEINEEFLSSIDYFKLAQDMINYLDS